MFDDLKQYINNRIAYTKLEIVDSVSNMAAVGVFGILVGMFAMLILLVGSLAVGFLLGNWFDNLGMGFLALLGFYLILLLILFSYRKKLMAYIADKTVEAAMDAIQNSEDTDEE